jgi:HSP20 family molecular chaperone IbpA
MRSFTLPDTADVTRATAACKDGLLHVHLPKVETAKPKTVEVKEAA